MQNSVMNFLGDFDSDITTEPQFVVPASICVDPEQPRKTFENDSHNNLMASISEVGILSPILVKDLGEGEYPKYMIISGERRWRAAMALNLEKIPVYIRNDLDEWKLKLAQVAENTQRSDLTDYEIAKQIENLLATSKLKKKDLAAKLNRQPSYISRLIAMLNQEWRPLVENNIIDSANVLERFKALDEATQNQLVESAKKRQVPISREAIDSLAKSAVSSEKEDFEEIQVTVPKVKKQNSSSGTNSKVKVSLLPKDLKKLVKFLESGQKDSTFAVL